MIGYINKLETFSAVDGPGVRICIFMQGCPLRCKFCHNPETWKVNVGDKYTPKELFDIILKYKNYIKNGGVTFSGGEPLVQSDFLLEILKMCKKNNIHTCLDTAGTNFKNEDILLYTDLVILDIKALDDTSYIDMTNKNMEDFWLFLNTCEKLKKQVLIRQVIIPGINDNEQYVLKLKEMLNSYRCIQRIELLPYHNMGIEKYEKLGVEYPLKDILAMDKKKCKELQEKIGL